ncbi:MAG: Phytochrome-like protein cph2 [Candidatus Omnitrophica bacterium ADurb.Bin292]|nr:MAG: Phytochrome-like protein cph2 [Candidatus Omnitrophica bacterium ADurb.Bin292]
MIEKRGDVTSWNILLVEDDLDFANILKIRLSKERNPSLAITISPSLERALDSLRINHYDLILLDLMLPDSSGIETFSKIKAEARHKPVVIITGLDNDQVAIDAVRRGAEDYLVKSDISSRFLTRIIHHAIDRHRIKEKLASVTGRLRETSLRLEKMALMDPLTELFNRRGLQQALTRELQLMLREGHGLLALLLDIDNFKHINDSLGHPVGDMLLKEIAKKIKEVVRESDHVARIGGDEFILLLPKTSHGEGIHLAERIRMTIADTVIYVSDRDTLQITASIGLTPVSSNVTSVDELLAIANPLLRQSKQKGKNCISLDEEEVSSADAKISTYAEQLSAVLRRGTDFFALKQPILNLTDLSIIGYEFLSRLNNGSIVMPNDFFRIAREQNMLTLVDHYCFRSCISASAPLAPELYRHINLFPATIVDISPDEVVEKLSVSCPAKSYCLEISEQQILGDPSHLIDPVETFKRSGVSIAIDDVGFGNTCLENLILLEPDVIKLDKRYIRGIARDAQIEKTLRRVLKIAEDLDAEVIAEGIESREDLDTLRGLGVKYGQGFYLGAPA